MKQFLHLLASILHKIIHVNDVNYDLVCLNDLKLYVLTAY